MEHVAVNYVAVIIAAVAGFLVGWAWYTLFGGVWLKAQGRRKGEDRASPVPFVLAAFANLLMAFLLAGLVGHLHEVTVRGAVISALFIWAGFVATTTLVNQQFEGISPIVTAIDAGHWLAVLIVMAVIIGAFGA